MILVNFDEPARDGANATVWRSDSYDKAVLYLHPEWRTWGDNQSNQILVHELLHLVMRDLEEAYYGVESLVSDTTWEALHHRFNHEMEGAVDRLATQLVNLAFS